MLLKIVQVGDPVLRERAQTLSRADILSAPLQQLIELMRATMYDAPGVGLAAPQIGESLQLAVIEDRADFLAHAAPEDLAAKQRRPVPFHVIVNPELEILEGGEVVFTEGCLSVRGFLADVPRALAVRVRALDHRAEPVTIEASGWYARILQHEIDHLHGQLYIDRMHSRTFGSLEARGEPRARPLAPVRPPTSAPSS